MNPGQASCNNALMDNTNLSNLISTKDCERFGRPEPRCHPAIPETIFERRRHCADTGNLARFGPCVRDPSPMAGPPCGGARASAPHGPLRRTTIRWLAAPSYVGSPASARPAGRRRYGSFMSKGQHRQHMPLRKVRYDRSVLEPCRYCHGSSPHHRRRHALRRRKPAGSDAHALCEAGAATCM